MKILVVDDDLELLGLISFALRQAGYLVVQAADGEEALVVFQHEQPDLVILDINLPKRNGLEVCRQIRSEASTPIMLLTVRSSEEDQVTGLDQGADDYLTKPFSPRTLLARVRALLRRAGLERSALQTSGDMQLDAEQQTVRVWRRADLFNQPRVSAAPIPAGECWAYHSRRAINDPCVGLSGRGRPAVAQATRPPPAPEDRA